MSNLRQAAQQALEALELYLEETNSNVQRKAITFLRAALAQEEQEDIAQNLQSRLDAAKLLEERRQEIAQPRREWQSLTDEEIQSLTHHLDVEREYEAYTGDEYLVVNGASDFARAIEAALKERNHG